MGPSPFASSSLTCARWRQTLKWIFMNYNCSSLLTHMWWGSDLSLSQHCCTPTVLVICLVFAVLWRSLTVCAPRYGKNALFRFRTSNPTRSNRPVHRCLSGIWLHERGLWTRCFNSWWPGLCNWGLRIGGARGGAFLVAVATLGMLSESKGEERLLFLPALALRCSLLFNEKKNR